MRMWSGSLFDEWGSAAWLIIGCTGLVIAGGLLLIGSAVGRPFEDIGELDDEE